MSADRAVVMLIEVRYPICTACVRGLNDPDFPVPVWKLPAETSEPEDKGDRATASRGAEEETGAIIDEGAWLEILSEERHGRRGFHKRILMHARIDSVNELLEIGHESDHELEVASFTYDEMVEMAREGDFLKDHIELLQRAGVIQ